MHEQATVVENTSDIFTEEDMATLPEEYEQEESVLPDVRKPQDVKVQFTEKRYPNLPARESHLKEPPYPKSKKLD